MNTKDLIAMAKLLLEGAEPGGWKFARYDGEIIAPSGYIVAESVLVGDGDFIAVAPDLVRELVEALEKTLTESIWMNAYKDDCPYCAGTGEVTVIRKDDSSIDTIGCSHCKARDEETDA